MLTITCRQLGVEAFERQASGGGPDGFPGGGEGFNGDNPFNDIFGDVRCPLILFSTSKLPLAPFLGYHNVTVTLLKSWMRAGVSAIPYRRRELIQFTREARPKTIQD
jgi:hypothetical protein